MKMRIPKIGPNRTKICLGIVLVMMAAIGADVAFDKGNSPTVISACLTAVVLIANFVDKDDGGLDEQG